MMKAIFPGFLLFVLCLPVLGQNTQTSFGQNRVQYKEFDWSFYDSDHFITYFYLGGQDLGKFVIQAAEAHLSDIENKLEYKIDNKIEILVYNNLSDLQQTNIGVDLDDFNTGGETKINGNKVFVYFDGNHQNLIVQVREGISRIFITDMLYGGNVQEVLQNAVLLNLPTWFVEGIISYIGEEWNTELDNYLRDGILSGKYKKFNKLSGDDAKFAGHAIWYYIGLKYGETAVPNLLYLTRINRSLESGFLFVLGKTFNQSIDEWYYYFFNKYTKDLEIRKARDEKEAIDFKTKKQLAYSNLKISNDGKRIAFVTKILGQYKVYIHDIGSGKTTRIAKGGYKIEGLPKDEHYPIIDWSPAGNKLAVIYEKRNKIKLLTYDVGEKKKEVKPVTKFQKVLDMSFMNPRTVILSAVNKGQSDIFTYHIQSTRVEKITNDFYDDLQPRFIKAGKKEGILFLSNRNTTSREFAKLDTLVPMYNFDVYFFDYRDRDAELIRVTNTPWALESMPMDYDAGHFSYLSDKNGINNRYIAYFDSTVSHYDTLVWFGDSATVNPSNLDSLRKIYGHIIDSITTRPVYMDIAVSYPVTNHAQGIMEQDLAVKARKSAELLLDDGRFQFYLSPLLLNPDSVKPPYLNNSSFKHHQLKKISAQSRPAPKPVPDKQPVKEEKKETPEDKIDIENYYFQSEFNQPEEISDEPEPSASPEAAPKPEVPAQEERVFRRSKVLPYRVKFATDNVVTQIDNSILFGNYQSLSTGTPAVGFPSLSPFIRASISDLMEDYRIIGGVRFPFGFNGTEYFMSYHNLKKRLDKKVLLYRGVKRGELFGLSFREKNTIGLLSLTWPLDIVKSLRGHFMYRHDKAVPLATEQATLELPPYFESWISYKMEYVFDNSTSKGINIRNGTRYKIFGEFHKQFELPFLKNDETYETETGHFSVVGFDIRHYQKIHKQIIFASRLAGGTSFGSKKLVYLLGGVDSWYGNNLFDESNQILPTANYGYSSYATNLRGFRYNIRNGSSHALLNNELRVPIFTYLINKPIRSKFIENFQVVGFYDIGTAWEGKSPYEQDNPFNTETLGGYPNPITIKVNYFRNPFVSGHGFGFRSMVFGYFMRLDFAWGREDGITSASPMTYFSLSLDF